MPNQLTNIIAALLLLTVFLLALFSILDDSLTFDEVSHIPAGFSYLTQKDMRINPEHPPLIKDLSALPLLFSNLNFPEDHPSWIQETDPVWQFQFEFGSQFLYHSGNDPDKILLLSRLPMILILVFLGWFLFRWTKKIFGNKAGVLALFLYSFSPTLLAHGRLVTTDLGAAAGIFIATYFFIKFLKSTREPPSLDERWPSTKKNLIMAGVFLGLAGLTKFSTILLFPFFGILVFVWAIIKSSNFKGFLINFARYLGFFILIVIIAFVVIWAFYQYHVWNYPAERQLRDTEFLLSSVENRILVNPVIWMAQKPVLRPIAHYFLGLSMVLQRNSGGHTTYFLGEISSTGWKTYFPIVYAIKEPLTFHILLTISLLYLAWLIKKPFWKEPIKRVFNWIKSHFTEFSMLLFIGIYWIVSLKSNLNIGVRHLLPVIPFTILLVAGVINKWLEPPYLKTKRFFLAWLLLWQAFVVVSIYPYFLAYFNELIGRPDQGYIYTTDSNLDWGQDLKRLKNWVAEKGINKVYVDYFGGGNPEYYLKEKYAPWWGTRDPKELPKGSYLAVSATLLQGGRGQPAPGFEEPTGYYLWLNSYRPVAKIGYSIFVYYIQ